MTWPLTPCCFMSLGDAFPPELEGLVGVITADLGAASRPGPAVVVAAPPHRADGGATTILVARGRKRRRPAGRRAQGPVGRARALPSVEHGGQVGPGRGGRERRRPGGGERRLGIGRNPA